MNIIQNLQTSLSEFRILYTRYIIYLTRWNILFWNFSLHLRTKESCNKDVLHLEKTEPRLLKYSFALLHILFNISLYIGRWQNFSIDFLHTTFLVKFLIASILLFRSKSSIAELYFISLSSMYLTN